MTKNDGISRALIAAADKAESEKYSRFGKCFLIVILYLLMMFATIVIYRLSGEAPTFINIALRALQGFCATTVIIAVSWMNS